MKKKSILFVADQPNWAYHNIVKTWSEELHTQYDCYVVFAEDYAIRIKKFSFKERFFFNISRKIKFKDKYYYIDSSRNFSYPIHRKNTVQEVISNNILEKQSFDIMIEMAYYFQYFSQLPFKADKKLIGIYTDSFPHEGPSYDAKNSRDLKKINRKEFYNLYLKQYDGIIVGNRNLWEDYIHFTQKIVFANGILGQENFVENTSVGQKEGLCIGWTGNPNRSMKGFKEVIIPALEAVQKTGRLISLKTKFSGAYEDLFSFYKDVDVVLIASEADTGPSLFAEASLCNVPSISTEIGFPKMIVNHLNNGIFVKRAIKEFQNALIEVYDNREILKSFSRKIKHDYLHQLDNKISIENLKNYLNKF